MLGPSRRIAPGGVLEFLLAPLAVGAGLAKAAGQHDRGGGAGLRQFAHRLHHAVGSEQHEPDIGRRRQRAHVGIARQAGDVLIARIDRIDLAGESRAASDKPPGGR